MSCPYALSFWYDIDGNKNVSFCLLHELNHISKFSYTLFPAPCRRYNIYSRVPNMEALKKKKLRFLLVIHILARFFSPKSRVSVYLSLVLLVST